MKLTRTKLTQYGITPEEEAEGWRYAKRAGIIDSWGGMGWAKSVAWGKVSPEALALLGPDAQPDPELLRELIAERALVEAEEPEAA